MSDLNVRAQQNTPSQVKKYKSIEYKNNQYEITMADGSRIKVAPEDLPKFLSGNTLEQKSSKDDFKIPGLTVERSSDGTSDSQRITGLSSASIEEDEGMKTKKEYKQMRKERQAQYQDEFSDYDDYTKKMAKKDAKQSVEITRAADRVIASDYYTDEEAYKAAKKNDKETGRRSVLLTENDMELLTDQNWDDAFEGRKRDKNGNIVQEGKLNSDKLKQIAAERIGMDNELEMEERKSETMSMADEAGLKNGKITHNKARKTKNLYKHLGFDYQKDSTELKRAAYVVATTLGGAAAGRALAKTGLGKSSGSGVAEGGEITVPGQNYSGTVTDVIKENGVITSIKDIPYSGTTGSQVVTIGDKVVKVGTTLSGAKGAALGALIGSGIGLATMGKVVNDLENKKNDILQGSVGGIDEAVAFVEKGDVSGVKNKDNQIMMDKTIKMAQEKGLTNEQIAASILGARGSNNCLSEKELLKLYEAVKEYEPAPIPTTPAPIPTTPAPIPTTPEPECHDVETKDVYKTIKIPQYRTGSYYISHGYVNEDGSKLSEADRRALQKELGKDENRVGLVTQNGRRTGIQLKNEITLPSGKVVRAADDAYDRIMAQEAHGGGNDPKYNVERRGQMMRALDCKTGQPKTQWMTPEEFAKWEEQQAKKNS